MRLALTSLLALHFAAAPAHALDRPWISDTFFYWYTWDYDKELGGWMGGIHNTPLSGYYDSRTLKDNRRSLWQASEWGLTHHWIDYWGHDWRGENDEPRERTVLRAAEDVGRAGYDIHMGYYQDGENFEMTDFSKNVSEQRDVYRWLRDYAGSPVWIKHHGKPYQLVYGRNGAPKTTIDHEGFRRWLRERYGSLDRLNTGWGTQFKDFDAIDMDFGAAGHQRALSIKYQYELWRREWAKLDGLVKQDLGYPGMCASFDVAYQPYLGFGYSDFARVLSGPHSYGGIFAAPEDQDVERFIQAAVAKHYDTVFFDHFKNYYHDWDIRVPGFAFLPEPAHFDRFWTGALMRYSEALLHLSWNEWWEGSNLEPCQEWGKTYCEKNLLYATLMKHCFDSIHQWNRGAKVAVLLNDWHWLAGGHDQQEIYQTIQALRRANVPFDLLPDDFVTGEALSKFHAVIAPAARTGFGYNQAGARISAVLARWVGSAADRRLVFSEGKQLADAVGIERLPAGPCAAPSSVKDMNVFVDVGAEGDDKFLVNGSSPRENWGKLPPGSFGAGTGLTCRWTPAAGSATTFLLPTSPQRDHVLRLQGSALWANVIEVRLNGERVGEIAVKPGVNEYALAIPAAAIGDSVLAEVQLRYQKKNVPHEIDPERFPSEDRVCNLALDWLQLSTDNIPARTTKQQYTMPKSRVDFVAGPLAKLESVTTGGMSRVPFPVTGEGIQLLSSYSLNGSPRDATLPVGKGKCWYVNGSFEEIVYPAYWNRVLSWAGAKPSGRLAGDGVLGAFLRAGDTVVALARNDSPGDVRSVEIVPPAGPAPVASVTVLSRDGARGGKVNQTREGARDQMRYYGVYEIVRSPLRVDVPELALELGETRTVAFRVKNVSKRSVTGTLQVTSVIPTVGGSAVTLSKPLTPGQSRTVAVPVSVKDTADWGLKTVAIRVECNGRTAWLFRPLTVLRRPELDVRPVPGQGETPCVAVSNNATPHGRTASAQEVALVANGVKAVVGTLAEGERRTVTCPAAFASELGQSTTLQVQYRSAAGAETSERRVYLRGCPGAFKAMAGALAPLTVCNPLDRAVENWPVSVALHAAVPKAQAIGVRDEEGVAVPSQVLSDGRVCFAASLPRYTSRTYYACLYDDTSRTDLQVSHNTLGTGQGTVTVSNSVYRLTLSEAAGGTAISFTSIRTGDDYGDRSFGANYGRFSQHDPKHPVANSIDFIHERKVNQFDSPGRLRVIDSGPCRVVVEAAWHDANLRASQRYEFYAYQPFLRVHSRAVPASTATMRTAQELVALDARFRVNQLAKTFPNFVGERTDKDQPVFGWRYGYWIPPYVTLMTPDDYQESVSLIPLGVTGVDMIRQGLWPRKRPTPGPCARAQAELVSRAIRPVEVQTVVLLHPGYQVVAKQLRNELLLPPAARAPKQFQWPKEHVGAAGVGATWHHPLCAWRVPVTVTASAQGAGAETIEVVVPATRAPQVKSVVVTEVTASGECLGDRPCLWDSGRRAVSWQVAAKPGEVRRYELYLADHEGSGGLFAVGALPPAVPELRTQTFESEAQQRLWQLGGVTLEQGQGHSGEWCLKLSCQAQGGPSVATSLALAPLPGSQYRVTFWAKALTDPCTIRWNFFHSAPLDFPQAAVPLTADGEWHQYETTLPVGAFPAHQQPRLRLWVVGGTETALVDDVSATPTGQRPVPRVAVAAGPAESRSR